MDEAALKETITRLWRRSLGPAEGLDMTPCPVSGNNRVFQVHADGLTAVVKWYCDGGLGAVGRDRLDAEWNFLEYAAAAGLTCVPRAIARDDQAGVALHGYLTGSKPRQQDVGAGQVAAAAGFFRALNQPGLRQEAAKLGMAAEAAFSGVAQFAIVERRLSRLNGIEPATIVDWEARSLVGGLVDHWHSLRRRLEKQLADLGIDPAEELPLEQRCVTPSDFGFHNTLLQDDGTLAFIDFEYAGWDDPAKTICDFLLQPALPINPVHREPFVAAMLDTWPDAERLARRARLMLPVFALKWCCIMLNPFVASLARPGRFADPMADDSARKQRQLARAQAAFHSLCMEE
jgi:hypothetical protein